MESIKAYSASVRSLFNNSLQVNKTGLQVNHYEFDSSVHVKGKRPEILKGDLFYHELVDHASETNLHFSYPVIFPAARKKYERCLVMLHGLNEKSWDKYMAWAGKLAEKLKQPVILFPIAYHMNRAPQSWSNPREMKNVVTSRKDKKGKNETSFANAALSTRLSAKPEQFVYSGIQSYYDVWQLLKEINEGRHPLFEQGTRADFFAYSIGAFLAEILFFANPGDLLTQSRLFLFAGGPTFDSMMGRSRYIMDMNAFQRLLTLKKKRVLKPAYRILQAENLPDFETCWTGFMGMFSMRKGRKIRKSVLSERGMQIFALSLEKDRVMPYKRILKTLKGRRKKLSTRVDVIDFPYSYSHENPFPMNDDKILPLVERSLDVVVNKAIRFYQSPVEQAVPREIPGTQVQGQIALA